MWSSLSLALVWLLTANAKADTPARPSTCAPGQPPDFVAIAHRVLPSVVSIEAALDVRRSAQVGASPYELAAAGDTELDEVSEGSGFVVEPRGLILTNYHVVEGVDSVMVTLTSESGAERTMVANVIGTAPDYDVALIETVENAHAASVDFADSDALAVGAWVMAVGNPFGLTESVSVGIVSAKGRRDLAPAGRPGIYDFLQTDAAVNPGNSGGPLIDSAGRVVGMNTAINAEGVGLSFAIPSNMLRYLVSELRQHRIVKRGWIGVTLQPLTSDLAQSFGLTEARGALVSEVLEGSPAAKAGLRDGDIVVHYGDHVVERSSDLPIWVAMTRPGGVVGLRVWRAGRPRDISVTIGEARDSYEIHDAQLGLILQPVMPDIQDDLGLKNLRGAYVAGVDKDSPAALAGLAANDVIIRVGGREMLSVNEAHAALHHVKAGAVLRLVIVRQGERWIVGLRR